MDAHSGKRSHEQRAIERLARESRVAVNEVAQLYEDARTKLEVGARIKGFLGIFAIRNVRKMLRQRKQFQASVFVLCIALAGWTGVADAGPFSLTAPVIAILDGELLVGEVTAHLAGWGTIALHSRSKAELTCAGEYSATEALGDAGQLRCSDGASATFQFQRLSLRRGYGAGISGSALSFTYGLTAEESAPYLKLPAGKELTGEGNHLTLVAAVAFPLR
jgi:Protein of unknown function (DUF3562)